jgi:hypothetical protein
MSELNTDSVPQGGHASVDRIKEFIFVKVISIFSTLFQQCSDAENKVEERKCTVLSSAGTECVPGWMGCI